MYAYSTPEQLTAEVDFKVTQMTELHYWRKHPNLHGWMRQLYDDKGGRDEQFNCVAVRLTADDLARLEEDVRAGRLPQTTGFFFGASDGTELEDDLRFVADAREALSAGLCVFYTSWW
jgi:hypothetical protein